MQPLIFFRSESLANKFSKIEIKKRLHALNDQREKMTQGEYRGVKRSITHGITVQEIDVEFSDESLKLAYPSPTGKISTPD